MSNTVSGILKFNKNQSPVLRDPKQPFRQSPRDVIVGHKLIRQYSLVEGATITGTARKNKNRLELTSVESVCGLSPDDFKKRTPYTELTAIDPDHRFNLSAAGEKAMRIVDLIAPIGKGTRGLIVSPPKAGKTILLEQIANGIVADDPDTHVIVLLIDERPEEVTYFRRAVNGVEVIASTSDNSIQDHIELTEIILARVRVELECGCDVVVLVDSLTRMGRNFNHKNQPRNRGGGRTLSGGLGVGAMEIPRRFFGLARNVENGGSVTIIATCLVNTGSRMDQLIFEEFKGTGNSEIILDRSLAEARIFPAIDLSASGTRKEENFYSPQQNNRIATLRRVLTRYNSTEAIASLFKLLDQYPTNEAFLQSIEMAT